MTRYLIKATYQSGPHAGKSYLLRKGGFVTDETQHQWEDTTYSSAGIAERECRRLKENNDASFEDERWENERRIRNGGKGKAWFIHERETYEPYKVEL